LARTLTHDGWNLVAQALATPGGHQNQRIATIDDVADDVTLRATKAAVAKNLFQNRINGQNADSILRRKTQCPIALHHFQA
jgi:hypothetical protein